jgi:hypothetical protein
MGNLSRTALAIRK